MFPQEMTGTDVWNGDFVFRGGVIHNGAC